MRLPSLPEYFDMEAGLLSPWQVVLVDLRIYFRLLAGVAENSAEHRVVSIPFVVMILGLQTAWHQTTQRAEIGPSRFDPLSWNIVVVDSASVVLQDERVVAVRVADE